MFCRIRWIVAVGLVAGAVVWSRPACAQIMVPEGGAEQEEPAEEPAAPPKAGANGVLVTEQQRIADQFKHLEEVLLRMAEVSAGADPRRAALLRQAVAQSKQRLIGVQFETLISLLNKDQLSRAVENQDQVDQDLRGLLELLLSEDRSRRIESEKARLREYLKRVEGLLKQQKSLQGRTTGGEDLKKLAKPQGELAQQAGGLAETIKSNEEKDKSRGEKSDKKAAAEAKQSKGAGDAKESKQSGEGKESKESKESRDSKGPEKSGAPQGKAESPSPQEEQPSSAQKQPENPTQQRLEAAEKRMREAQEKLEQAQREGAAEKQEEAIRELEQAKAALEQILRQLREEEIGRTLTLLEARCRKMLQMQREVYEGTVRLDKVPEAERSHSQDIEAGRLSSKESEIVLEADKALTLMRDDGTAVAFLEAAGQMREDMQQVVERLAQSKVDRMTQGIEEDILAALEDMIGALVKAQKDLEDKKQQQPSMQGEMRDPPLVDLLSELKMIRALQMRVNSRTERYSKMIDGEQATATEMLEALKRLAERQERIYRVTHELGRGANR